MGWEDSLGEALNETGGVRKVYAPQRRAGQGGAGGLRSWPKCSFQRFYQVSLGRALPEMSFYKESTLRWPPFARRRRPNAWRRPSLWPPGGLLGSELSWWMAELRSLPRRRRSGTALMEPRASCQIQGRSSPPYSLLGHVGDF